LPLPRWPSYLTQAALQPGADAFETTGLLLVATLLGLAALEHLFLVLPMPLDGLWEWSLKSRRRGEALHLDDSCRAAPVAAIKVEP
jgi:hypothetical protein